MNFRFKNLIGAPYRGGNVVIVNNTEVVSPVGNRISVTDPLKPETLTLADQASSNISRIAASPDGVFLLAVDENRRCLFINLRRRVVLHRITFKYAVNAVKFSPNGAYIAVAAGKLLQIWRSPGFRKEFFPFELVRNFADFDDKITALDWSPDSNYVLAGSKDLTARLFCLEEVKSKSNSKPGQVRVKPFMFLGHRDSVVGGFFGVDKNTNKVNRVYTVARDGYIFSWGFTPDESQTDDMEVDDSEPPSPDTPDRDSEGNLEENDTENPKKRKALSANDGNLEVGGGYLRKGKWELLKKDSSGQAPAKLTTCDYHRGLDMMVAGFSNGVFALYQMPDFVCIHLLSISREKITTAVFNELGSWLALGCAKLGQLLVWNWRSTTYEMKQQGHYFDVNCLAYTPDSQQLATGADDYKVKVHSPINNFFRPRRLN